MVRTTLIALVLALCFNAAATTQPSAGWVPELESLENGPCFWLVANSRAIAPDTLAMAENLDLQAVAELEDEMKLRFLATVDRTARILIGEPLQPLPPILWKDVPHYDPLSEFQRVHLRRVPRRLKIAVEKQRGDAAGLAFPWVHSRLVGHRITELRYRTEIKKPYSELTPLFEGVPSEFIFVLGPMPLEGQIRSTEFVNRKAYSKSPVVALASVTYPIVSPEFQAKATLIRGDLVSVESPRALHKKLHFETDDLWTWGIVGDPVWRENLHRAITYSLEREDRQEVNVHIPVDLLFSETLKQFPFYIEEELRRRLGKTRMELHVTEVIRQELESVVVGLTQIERHPFGDHSGQFEPEIEVRAVQSDISDSMNFRFRVIREDGKSIRFRFHLKLRLSKWLETP